jgi:hypothetical protein
MAPVSELVESGVWLFPAQRTVEGVLVFSRLWLRRELQLIHNSNENKNNGSLSLTADELDEQLSDDEELCLRMCCLLAFGMFKRGMASCTWPQAAQTMSAAVVSSSSSSS